MISKIFSVLMVIVSAFLFYFILVVEKKYDDSYILIPSAVLGLAGLAGFKNKYIGLLLFVISCIFFYYEDITKQIYETIFPFF